MWQAEGFASRKVSAGCDPARVNTRPVARQRRSCSVIVLWIAQCDTQPWKHWWRHDAYAQGQRLCCHAALYDRGGHQGQHGPCAALQAQQRLGISPSIDCDIDCRNSRMLVQAIYVCPQIWEIPLWQALVLQAGTSLTCYSGRCVNVWLQVPVSTTFLNGLILCDVKNVTAVTTNDVNVFDALTCVTRPHLATDASSEDAMARNLEARDTQPG